MLFVKTNENQIYTKVISKGFYYLLEEDKALHWLSVLLLFAKTAGFKRWKYITLEIQGENNQEKVICVWTNIFSKRSSLSCAKNNVESHF